IGGYSPIKTGGIDLIPVLGARGEGWGARTFTQENCLPPRPAGRGQYTGVRAEQHKGREEYLLGRHPAPELPCSVHQMKHGPYIVGGLLILAGYLWTMLTDAERTMPGELIALRRQEQMQRLRGILRRLGRFERSRPVAMNPPWSDTANVGGR